MHGDVHTGRLSISVWKDEGILLERTRTVLEVVQNLEMVPKLAGLDFERSNASCP